MSVITRFAPSPTGDLHIGSVRTALYCWLFARKNNGKMILRIEDTDLERSTKQSVDIILAGLKWLNLLWDEGPFFQTERFTRYKQVTERLLATQDAYYCDCSKERLENLRKEQMQAKQKPKYDGHCRNKNLSKTANSNYVIRFKNPLTGYVEFNDLVRGTVKIANHELDDLIIVRSDGTPTYNLTVVVDDFDMKVTDVIRGEDHISNTPKQINILKALGANIPNYAHIPMILGGDGARLSKRHGAASVLDYEKMGILPQALINYLVRLGWAYKDQEIFSTEELINLFDIKDVHKSAGIFNIDKLLWLNHHYLSISKSEALISLLKQQLKLLDTDVEVNINHNKLDLIKIIDLYKNRVKTLKEMAEEIVYFYQENIILTQENLLLLQKHLTTNSKIVEALNNFLIESKNLSNWDTNNIHDLLKSLVVKFNIKFSELAIPLRIMVANKTNTPSIDQVLTLLGKQQVLTRVSKGLNISLSEGL